MVVNHQNIAGNLRRGSNYVPFLMVRFNASTWMNGILFLQVTISYMRPPVTQTKLSLFLILAASVWGVKLVLHSGCCWQNVTWAIVIYYSSMWGAIKILTVWSPLHYRVLFAAYSFKMYFFFLAFSPSASFLFDYVSPKHYELIQTESFIVANFFVSEPDSAASISSPTVGRWLPWLRLLH